LIGLLLLTLIANAQDPNLAVKRGSPQSVDVNDSDTGSEINESGIVGAEEIPADMLSTGSAAEIDVSKASEAAKLRNPFYRITAFQASEEISDLLKYPADQFKLVGVMTGPKELKALIVDPNGKTHFVTEQTRIGVRNGVIRKILAEKIEVLETFKNVLGERESVVVEIEMPGIGT